MKLAKLSPSQRAEIVAFDQSVRRHKWLYRFGVIAVWLAAAVAFRYGVDKASWLEALTVTFLLIGVTGFAVLSAWFGHSKFTMSIKTVVLVLGLAIAGALVGGMFGRYVKVGSIEGVINDFGSFGGRVMLAGLIVGGIYAALLLAVVQVKRRVLQGRNDELARQVEQDRIARQLADARLKLMQAQVEPHFLFNTLASVQQLAEGKAPEAAALTRELITFLRAGLSGLRDDTTTLECEFAMAAAFLAIMKTRMGERLSFSLDLPPDLRDRAVPPAMLISLVENAIKHGLEPSTAGGQLLLRASEVSDDKVNTLTIEVSDTGLGLGAAKSAQMTDSGGGVGLSNVRERLSAIYCESARLQIEENSPRGVVARVTITKPVQAELSPDNPTISCGSVK
ncbi:MAG: histidine kinase [Aeromicrobium sp.]|nr:histidine kinase [Burkholderiales bacterium]